MKSRDFCYWLQGYFEIHGQTWEAPTLDTKQVETIQKHLALVFKHEIDPEAGSSEHQESLNATHNKPRGGEDYSGTIFRC
jgi:hypothetical protein